MRAPLTTESHHVRCWESANPQQPVWLEESDRRRLFALLQTGAIMTLLDAVCAAIVAETEGLRGMAQKVATIECPVCDAWVEIYPTGVPGSISSDGMPETTPCVKLRHSNDVSLWAEKSSAATQDA